MDNAANRQDEKIKSSKLEERTFFIVYGTTTDPPVELVVVWVCKIPPSGNPLPVTPGREEGVPAVLTAAPAPAVLFKVKSLPAALLNGLPESATLWVPAVQPEHAEPLKLKVKL